MSVKPQFSYKQAAISFFVNHGTKLLSTSVLMVLFDVLLLVCDPRNLKLIILAFLVVLVQLKIVDLGCFAIRVQGVGSRDPISYS